MILMSVTGVNMGNMALLLEHPRRGLLEHPRTGLAGESTERNDHDSFAMFGWPLAIKTRKIKNVDYFTKARYFLFWTIHVWTNGLFWCCYPGASLAWFATLDSRHCSKEVQLDHSCKPCLDVKRMDIVDKGVIRTICQSLRQTLAHMSLLVSLCWGPLSSFGGSKKPWGPAEDHQQVTPSKISTSKRLRLLRRYCTIGL